MGGKVGCLGLLILAILRRAELKFLILLLAGQGKDWSLPATHHTGGKGLTGKTN